MKLFFHKDLFIILLVVYLHTSLKQAHIMEFGIIKNPYENTNKDRVRYIGDYKSWDELKVRACDIAGNVDNWNCSNTRAHTYALSSLRCFSYLDRINSDDVISRLVSSFAKYRQNNQSKISGEFTPDYRVSGQVFDLGRVLSGEPECMIDFFASNGSAKRYLDVTFVIDSPTWLIHLKERKYSYLFRYFNSYLDLIDQWEQAGIRCKISGIMHLVDFGNISNDQFSGSLILKDYDEPLNLELFCRTLFTTQVSSYLISLGYAVLGKNPEKSLYMSSIEDEDMRYLEYNELQPDRVRFPGINDYKIQGDKFRSAEQFLKDFNYPITF